MSTSTLRTEVYERILVVNDEGGALGCLTRTKPYNPEQIDKRVKEVVKCELEKEDEKRVQ